MIWCNATKIQILISVLFLADLPVLPAIENMQKNHAKNHRIAIFTADDNDVKLEIEVFIGCYRFAAWPDNAANDKSDKPKPKGVT